MVANVGLTDDAEKILVTIEKHFEGKQMPDINRTQIVEMSLRFYLRFLEGKK